MRQQQRMKVMKEMIRKIRAKGGMDANNSWQVSELLSADCEKTWLHAGWEDTMQNWYEWRREMNKKDEAKKMEKTPEKVSQMIKQCRWESRALA